jgi:predicted DNA-binding protein (MmcQ/YjbR family)
MNRDQAISFCESLPHAEATFPFDAHTLVFKVATKMFAMFPLEKEPQVALKFPPATLEALRETHPAIFKGAYLNPMHWGGVYLDDSASSSELSLWIKTSYNLVVAKLPVAQRTLYPPVP